MYNKKPVVFCSMFALSVVVLANTSVHAQSSYGTQESAHDCMIEPMVLTEVGSASQGLITHMAVERGSEVSRGQVIAQLDARIESALLEQAEARAAIQSDVLARNADLRIAELDSQRFSDLHAQRLASEQQRDQAVARERAAKAAVLQALEDSKQRYIELDRARTVLEQRTIRSPIDGVVVKHQVSAGELVFDNPIMTVAQLDPLRIEVVLPARLFGSISVGDHAWISPELESETPIVARINVIDPLLDGKSGTFGVSLLLDNENRSILAGQKCRVSFEPADESLPASFSAQEHSDEMARNRTEPGAAAANPAVDGSAVDGSDTQAEDSLPADRTHPGS